jgi:hypothetical protein
MKSLSHPNRARRSLFEAAADASKSVPRSSYHIHMPSGHALEYMFWYDSRPWKILHLCKIIIPNSHK